MTVETKRGFWERYAAAIDRRRWLVLAGALLLTIAGAALASRLELKTDFSELLPRDAPSVRDLHRIESRVGAFSTLVIGIEGGDWKKREEFAERAVAALSSRLPPGHVNFIDYKVTEAEKFYQRNRFLYLDQSDLDEIVKRLKAKIQDEKERNVAVQLDDDPPLRFDVEDIRKKYEGRAAHLDRFPDGYFITGDRTMQALLLRISAASLGDSSTDQVIAEVSAILASLSPEKEGFQILVAGDPMTAAEERQGVVDDLVAVSVATILLVVLAIAGYYRSFRSLFLIGAPVATAVAIAFGVARLTIGSLNSNTGFLGSIIVGNGINFGIVFLARYAEARRSGGHVSDAVPVALKGTSIGTATAAFAASIAYGSLLTTSFRGFSQFGFIGAMGMLLCWIATYTVTPALLFALEGHRSREPAPKRAPSERVARSIDIIFGKPAPVIAALGIALSVASVVGAARFYRDPFEYNFHHLRSRRTVTTGAAATNHRVDLIFDGTGMRSGSPAVFLADRADQVPSLIAALEAKRDAGAPIGRIESIETILPPHQQEKIVKLNELRALLDDKVLGWVEGKERTEALDFRPPDGLRAIGFDDLPEILRRPFVERDGRHGLIVFVQSPPGTDFMRDGRKLLAFAEVLRDVHLPGGERLHTSGNEVITADILDEILRDGPLTTLVSFLGVLGLSMVALRRARDRLLVVGTLLVGVSWMCGAAALLGVKVNMLNFVALPITFGIGVEYPVNLYRRHLQEGPARLGHTIATTGSAVALCSLTTIIGYGSLLFADTQALNSFGLVAVIGEMTTITAALLFLPALTRLIERPKAIEPNVAVGSGSA